MLQMRGIILLLLLGVALAESIPEQQNEQDHDHLNQVEKMYLQDEDDAEENPSPSKLLREVVQGPPRLLQGPALTAGSANTSKGTKRGRFLDAPGPRQNGDKVKVAESAADDSEGAAHYSRTSAREGGGMEARSHYRSATKSSKGAKSSKSTSMPSVSATPTRMPSKSPAPSDSKMPSSQPSEMPSSQPSSSQMPSTAKSTKKR